MITKYKTILNEVAKQKNKDKKQINIIIKHFLKTALKLPSKRLSFKEHGMFHLYRKKKKKVDNFKPKK